MNDKRNKLALLTDLYELTMMQGYYLTNPEQQAVFEVFFRRQPFNSGFAIFAGLDPLIDTIVDMRFSDDDINYLKSLKMFGEQFLDYLRSYQFFGDICAMKEGSVVFPNEPLIRVQANLLEAQLLESIVLNMINFQTLVATKAARVVAAANGGAVIEFGLRRAHGIDGAISATRAAYIGGASATSNVMAGALFNIPPKGTMAHSWVMSFDNELRAFERYAELYPDNCVLLIDTYDTLKTGLPNAIKVFKKLKKKGYTGFGIRLDSGDLEYLSKRAREMLNKNNLEEVKIYASNELDEWIINQIVKNGAPIDAWGVGSKIVTADKDSSLTGVYKLAAKTDGKELHPVIKISNNPEKITNPGIKNILRFYDRDGMIQADLIYLEEEENELMRIVEKKQPITFHHPSLEHVRFNCAGYSKATILLTPVVIKGKRCVEPVSLQEIQAYAMKEMNRLDQTYKRLINPHIYKVSISTCLKTLKTNLIKNMGLGTGD
ncbi:MAG: nicotinate phosphoribosyltransferase [Candidatus Fischerbacteria bacterium RBG_13_37_8]|uniref:Nicotinate phosphoribosyltransferase n=1 Tax=Candidatus Fischerbacteria bacterium RBG_13_37_8 TaxID=1817863 RepID=A0A1F5VXT5_9BACT|nr:MAG: nicotinate phosphoribosyltransferase [Candidatus Fischerbacteria bacterium RBG_13_37_8]